MEVVGDFAGNGSKKLPPPPKDVVVWGGAGAAFGLVSPFSPSNGDACFTVCGGAAVEVDEKLRPLKASLRPPRPDDA